MNSVFITAIICATITALAWMAYDLRRRRIAAADKRAKTRTIEKEVLVEVPVLQGKDTADHGSTPAAPERRKGSLRGYYVGKDGTATEITGRSRKDEQQGGSKNGDADFYTRHI